MKFAFVRVGASPLSRNRRALAAGVLLVLIAAIAVGSAVLLATLERSRLRISAELEAFQLSTELLRVFDEDAASSMRSVRNLVAFGVYSRRGDALFQYGAAPDRIEPEEGSRQARFSGGVITLVRPIGMMAEPQGGPFRRRDTPFPQPGMMPATGAGQRFVYIAYKMEALRFGERVTIAVAALVVFSVAGAFALLLSLARSLDEYRNKEAKSRELITLGEAARTLAHEIKNPLGVVKIQCALLRKNSNQDLLPGIAIIEEEIDRLAVLTSRVKAFLSADKGDHRLVDIADAMDSYERRYGDRLEVRRPFERGHVFASIDPLKLDQVVDNLIANARESMAALDESTPLLYAELKPGRVCITVGDRGSGISAQNADRVYDLFFTTKSDGAGIGLSLAKRYVEAAGGSLTHRPREGGGTLFTLELPLAKDAKR